MRLIHTLIALSFTGAVAAADLDVGSPAPPLNIEKWIVGEPVVLADGKDKSIYVVEFWATWCGPCIRTIPHMTKLAKTFEKQGVKIIGVSIDGENTRSNVEPFVKKMGKKMDYIVASTGCRRRTTRSRRTRRRGTRTRMPRARSPGSRRRISRPASGTSRRRGPRAYPMPSSWERTGRLPGTAIP